MSAPIKRVIIVDDHDTVRRGVRQLIETNPSYQVVGEAADGRRAIEVAKKAKPDIVLLDYSLPQLNGLGVTLALTRAFPRLEVLLYTMHDREDIVMEVLRAGARGCILKADAAHELLGALDALSDHRPYLSAAISNALIQNFLQTRPPNIGGLTHREREIVQQVSEGHTNNWIAASLQIGRKTVETHRRSAMQKLNLRTTADLVRYAIRNNITQA